MPEKSIEEQMWDLRELFEHVMHSAIANAASLAVLEEVARAWLDSLSTAEREAIRARVSERVPGPGMAEPIAEAVSRLFGPGSTPSVRH
ncbi:MAG TPA: hypothetical protein VG651_24085 [Stellaceae bacterium]|nr:hypothetical protein [Stellaceae bacterium]